ncbi:hypothetical protein ACFQ1E_17435 [Sphingomonas canadensis]|uniref:Uncharacterized protein n=1 Tax=Sphingomonas canadensis TaxID=1219257 RepID=A0ABW3HBR3_9SPHN|nr:hypothetical protein [Sphingomonas canadensis]MCW3837831.1 hypothetical protein [Sphingomonas canadensis]
MTAEAGMARRGGDRNDDALRRCAAPRLAGIEAARAEAEARNRAQVRAARQARVERRAIEAEWRAAGGLRCEATPETLYRARRTRQGALARLAISGAITADQLAAAEAIRAVAERIGRDAAMRTASLETRVDGGRRGGAFFERLRDVREERAYRAWSAALGRWRPLVLAMIVEDLGIKRAARRYRAGELQAKRALGRALDDWPETLDGVRRSVDEVDVRLAHIRAGV